MKNTIKLIRRFLLLMVCVTPILIVLNLAVAAAFTWQGRNNNGGWEAAKEVGRQLAQEEDGSYRLSEAGEAVLAEYGAWGILIEDGTGDVVWHSDGLPEEIPLHYTAAEISWHTRGYIEDYPTTTGARGDDLVILGHPKTSYWKLMWNTFDYGTIAELPRMALSFLAVNVLLVFLIYMTMSSRILRSVGPVVQGLETLPEEDTYVRERGFLAEAAAAVNRVNEKLRAQERALRKKENARAGWISGVSHDIRTPLSMVMGYASELEEDASLPAEARRKAEVIRLQSLKMKNLVGDLNLASKLEYQMQPLHMESLNLAAVLRQAAVDFMNLDPEEKYPVDFQCQGESGEYVFRGDRALLQRAVYNILSNSQLHNPEGCHIFLELRAEGGEARILLEDDGAGATEEQLEKLRSTPHYLTGDGGTRLRHGLGLLIVRQIAAAHGGRVEIGQGREGGFRVELFLPMADTLNQGFIELQI